MVFYQDNEKRASRLQQLVDSMADLQTDVKDVGQKMDEKNTKYRPAIDRLLKAHGMDTVDDMINEAASKMTPEERKEFEALITVVKRSKSGFDATYFIAGLLMGAEGSVIAVKSAMAVARWGARIVNVKALANFFKATEAGTEAAAAAAEEVATAAEEAEKTLEEAGGVGEEVSSAATWLGRLGTFFRILGGIGFVVTLITGILELVKGEEQKEKLIEAIHALQPARLTTAFFKQEGETIMRQLETLDLYLDAMPGGADPDPDLAAKVSKKLISAITKENKEIDMNKLETKLEAQDRTSSLYYGDDNLNHDEVVAAASKTK